ncbi:hypothetical protein ABZ896_20630 [Streptomyces sp. NPDC047072]|uniref:hypothetical protein n=1 Tax=Streptomyces sp. NPDC047072 TaxID=3154809 RepID=UPI0033DABC08
METALRTGYRHIDTAAAYSDEREVGEGLRRSGMDLGEVASGRSSGTPTTGSTRRCTRSRGAPAS